MSGALTAVFPRSIKPVRPGPYEIVHKVSKLAPYNAWYSYWNGKQWNLTCGDPKNAVGQTMRSVDCYSRRMIGWRGLAAEPKAAA